MMSKELSDAVFAKPTAPAARTSMQMATETNLQRTRAHPVDPKRLM